MRYAKKYLCNGKKIIRMNIKYSIFFMISIASTVWHVRFLLLGRLPLE